MPTTSLEEELLKASLYLERFNPSSQKLLNDNLIKAQKEILALIGSTQNKATIRTELNKIMQNVFYNIPDTMQKDIIEISEVAYNSTTVIMAGYVSAELASNAKQFKDIAKATREKLLNPNTLIQGHSLEEHLKHLETTNARKLRGLIYKGYDEGIGIDAISKSVRDSIGHLNRNTARTLIRTSLLEQIDKAKMESFDYFSDEINSFRYTGVLDSRQTLYCRTAHGYVTDNIKKAKYQIHSHYNCRSMWIPITDISEDFETKKNVVEWERSRPTPKLAKNGKYSIGNSKAEFDTPKDALNYHSSKYGGISTKFKVDNVKKVKHDATGFEAFEAFSEKYKLEYLGKTRYKLYKDGKATLKEMIDVSRNSYIPLEKLYKKLNIN